MWYEVISSLKINLQKSETFAVGEIADVQIYASMFGCKMGSLSTNYLGLPLGKNYKSKKVEEKFRKRLSVWKRRYLSKGGRLTLIKIFFLIIKHNNPNKNYSFQYTHLYNVSIPITDTSGRKARKNSWKILMGRS